MIEKKVYVKDIINGQVLSEMFIVESVTKKQTKTNLDYYSCVVCDKTGKLRCSIWGGTNNFLPVVEVGRIYTFIGKVNEFNDALFFNINEGKHQMKDVTKDVEMNNLIREFVIIADVTELKELVELYLDTYIETADLRHIINELLTPRFYKAPAAISNHHAYRSGLAIHTLEVTNIALQMCSALNTTCPRNINPFDLDTELVVTAALLHDIGKRDSFSNGLVGAPLPRYYTSGHSMIGANLVQNVIDKIPADLKFHSSEYYEHLVHIIMSHHGEFSEVKPMTPEAYIVHFADNASATVTMCATEVKNLEPNTIGYASSLRQSVARLE